MENSLWKIWDDNGLYKIHETEYTLKGFSIAALRTNFYIPELGIMLDAGLSGNMCADHIMITHCHADHSANIPWYLFSKKPESKIKIYVPEESCTYINNYIDSAFAMTYNKSVGDSMRLYFYDMCPMTEGTFELIIKNKKFDIEIIKCDHSVPCIGYGFTEKRNKLKEEYLKLSGKDIAQLRKSGTSIYNEQKYSFFCYIGDTSRKVLNDKKLEKYSTIMIECTFLTDDDMENAVYTKHMHWKHLEDYIKSHPENQFILYHFSQRYKKKEIKDFFDIIKAGGINNIYPWIS